MPELVDVDLEARVGRAIETRRETIAELVRQAVDRELLAILEVELDAALERLEQRTNGAGPANLSPKETANLPASEAPGSLTPEAPPATSTSRCIECGEKPAAPGRRVCNTCRHVHARERRAAAATGAQGDADGDESRPAGLEPVAAAGERTAPQGAPSRAPGRFNFPKGREREARAEERRAAIEAARRNGVEQVEREGRTYTLIHIPPEAGRLAGTLDPA